MSNTEQTKVSEAKKNKIYASTLQKHINSTESMNKMLANIESSAVNIPGFDQDASFSESVKNAVDAINVLSAKLSSAHKTYTKGVSPTTRKTNSIVEIVFDIRSPH